MVTVDIADFAAQAEEMFRGVALAQVARHAPRGVSATACAECGEPIPEGRRLAVPGCERCADCQDVKEKQDKRRG